jgi:hypothetical protein
MSNISSGYMCFTCVEKDKIEKAIKLIEKEKSFRDLDLNGPIEREDTYEVDISFHGEWGISESIEKLSEIFTKVDTTLNEYDPIFEGTGYEYEFGQMSFSTFRIDYTDGDEEGEYIYSIDEEPVEDGEEMVEFLKGMANDPVGWVFEEGGNVAVSFIDDFPETAKKLKMLEKVKDYNKSFVEEFKEAMEDYEYDWDIGLVEA